MFTMIFSTWILRILFSVVFLATFGLFLKAAAAFAFLTRGAFCLTGPVGFSSSAAAAAGFAAPLASLAGALASLAAPLAAALASGLAAPLASLAAAGFLASLEAIAVW
eukprot:Mycagemm_TRINITY_DN10362_c0_g5::TRINITY_DN10362_c0_g5_i1::g.613::m.613 type:complete len:108 gc:universal TRINITY_DN10362_c0_g5_i1:351-28(-)